MGSSRVTRATALFSSQTALASSGSYSQSLHMSKMDCQGHRRPAGRLRKQHLKRHLHPRMRLLSRGRLCEQRLSLLSRGRLCEQRLSLRLVRLSKRRTSRGRLCEQRLSLRLVRLLERRTSLRLVLLRKRRLSLYLVRLSTRRTSRGRLCEQRLGLRLVRLLEQCTSLRLVLLRKRQLSLYLRRHLREPQRQRCLRPHIVRSHVQLRFVHLRQRRPRRQPRSRHLHWRVKCVKFFHVFLTLRSPLMMCAAKLFEGLLSRASSSSLHSSLRGWLNLMLPRSETKFKHKRSTSSICNVVCPRCRMK